MTGVTNPSILTALNIADLPTAIGNNELVEVLPTQSSDGNADEDFRTARETLLGAIETTKSAIDDLHRIAQQSQHPRAYEVLSNLINTLMVQQKDLLDLRKKKAEVKVADPSAGEITTKQVGDIHNHLYVGSTSELQKMIDDIRKK